MAWWDLDRPGAVLEPEVWQAMQRLDEDNVDHPDLRVCSSLADAELLLRASNAAEAKNELIALRNRSGSFSKGSVEVEHEIRWIGFDCFQPQCWSLLFEGLFFSPQCFPNWPHRLNQDGLFDTSEDALAFKCAYDEAASEGRVEPLPLDGEAIAIEVGVL